MSTDSKIHDFVKRQKELLELELMEDQEEVLYTGKGQNRNNNKKKSGVGATSNTSPIEEEQRLSDVVSALQVSQIGVGLYGRTVVTFISSKDDGQQKTNQQNLTHRLTTGDEVEIRSKTSGTSSSSSSSSTNPGGVICQVTDTSISVALFERNRQGRYNHKQQQQQQQQSKSKGASKSGNDDADDDEEFDNPPYSLVPVSSVQVHAKMVSALDELDKHGTNHDVAGHVIKALFEPSSSMVSTATTNKATTSKATTTVSDTDQDQQYRPFNPNLDHSQLDAIDFCLRGGRTSSSNVAPIALVHGPPGTGKTTTICELVLQAVRYHNYKVLVTAPSNVAVDTVLAKLVEQQQQSQQPGNKKSKQSKKLSMVRLGHPARLRGDILPYSLEHQVQNAEETQLVADARRELQSYLNVLQGKQRSSSKKKSQQSGVENYNRRQIAKQEIKQLRKEIRVREEKIVQELLQNSRVVLATCVGAGNSILKKHRGGTQNKFDLVIIDEAAQALEAACWIPTLLASTKLVLAGDHCQLPPTIKSTNPAVQDGLKQTMFERLLGMYPDNNGQSPIARMLQVQYRMNKNIANWCSEAMYHGKLQSAVSVQDHTLADLIPCKDEGAQQIDDDEISTAPKTAVLLYIDTAGCGMYESVHESSLSRYNTGEAQLVVRHIEYLLSLGLQTKDIAVITPYNGQVQVLKGIIQERFDGGVSGSASSVVEVRTVDGFQGGEREAIILSLVRSKDEESASGKNSGASIGFLRDDRRLNVAITRSKRHCCVIGDSDTLNTSPFVKNLLEWFMQHGEHRSAMEYASESDESTRIGVTCTGPSMTAAKSDLIRQTELQMQQFLNENSKSKDGSHEPKSVHPPAKSKKKEEERTNELVSKIKKFVETANTGNEMSLSAELTKFDRKIVHEQCEKMGIGHRSEGVEGVDRHITIYIPASRKNGTNEQAVEENATPVAVADAARNVSEESEPDVDETTAVKKSAFVALLADVEDDSEEESEHVVPDAPAMNSVLANLAKERAERQRQSQMKQTPNGGPPLAGSKKKNKKKGGQKLGGAKKAPEPKAQDVGMDDLDDMAFLEAQIDKVQNAHGRKLDGKGSYRTVMNGILIAKPGPANGPKKDPKASAALKTKLQQAQDGRKAKPKKK